MKLCGVGHFHSSLDEAQRCDRAQAMDKVAREIGVNALLDLIDDLTDADECWFDHHGYCQAHMWFETEPKCPHARAKEILAKRVSS